MEKPKTRVYIAGGMTGIPDFNFPAFDKAADLGRALGFEVVSPADYDRDCGFDETKNTLEGFDLKAAKKWDLEQISTCDAIALLPGWEKSTGARTELNVATWYGLQVLDALTFEPFETQKETVLEEAVRLTSSERQKVYGHPSKHFARTTAILNILFAHKLKEPFSTHEWGLIMAVDKIARFMNPNVELGSRDCLTDLAGYARTIEMVLEKEGKL